jgi:hypothetical protein
VFLAISVTLFLFARGYPKRYIDWAVSKNDCEQGSKANGSPPALEVNAASNNDQPNDSPDELMSVMRYFSVVFIAVMSYILGNLTCVLSLGR